MVGAWVRCRALFTLTLCVSIFVCYLGRGKKYSFFYKPDVGKANRDNMERVKRSVAYFESQTKNGPYPKGRGRRVNLCVAFVVSPRYMDYNQRYFVQSVASVLSRMSVTQRENSHVAVISSEANVTVGAHSQTIVDEATVRPFVDRWNRRVRPFGTGNLGSIREESVDYCRALRHCYKMTDAPVTLIIEDDALASPLLFRSVFDVAKKVVEADKSAFYIKLFASEAYFGWENRDIPLMVLIGSGTGIVWYLLWLARYDARKKKCSLSRRVVSVSRVGESVLLALFTVAMLKLVGKQYVFPPFVKGIHQIPWGAVDSNTVATVFPFREKIPAFLDYFSTTVARLRKPRAFRALARGSNAQESFAIDMILHRWTVQMKLSRYYCIPSLFQHIGVFSSKGWKNLAPYEALYRSMKTSATFGKEV